MSECIEHLESIYGSKDAPLAVHCGKKHDYLGMTLNYRTKGKVKIDMREYLNKILKDLPEFFDGSAASPAVTHLFDINENAIKLRPELSDMFHHVVAQLLFLCKQGRPDMQTAIAFLTTRVKEPDKDDLKKLKRAICYLRSTHNLVLTLECGEEGNILWWMDSSFAVHGNMRSHTGGLPLMGKGAVCTVSRKQKLNTKSSTKAELVAINDMMPQILWVRYFLTAQGFSVSDNILYQDNMITMKLACNGKASSRKRTCHINIILLHYKQGEVQGDFHQVLSYRTTCSRLLYQAPPKCAVQTVQKFHFKSAPQTKHGI